VAIGSGLVAAILGPFVIASAVPDSTMPFLLFGTAAGIASARAVEGRTVRAGLAVGVLLGLAWLSRQEAVYLGLAYLVMALPPMLERGSRERRRAWVSLLAAPVVGGLAVVVPWLVRNLGAFGTLFPGQALENVYLSRNEQIYAYLERPTLSSFLAQGPGTIAANQLEALWHDAFNVIALPAMPVGIIGVVAALALRRTPALAQASPLRALLIGGLITYLATSLLFPIATRWGTFLHASGPLLVGLIVVAMLGLDALVAAIGRRRGWARSNAWLAALLALAVAVPFTVLQVTVVGRQAGETQQRVAMVAARVAVLPEAQAGSAAGGPPSRNAVLLSDHPVWLAEALRRPVVALPDEAPPSVARLASDFGVQLAVVLDDRGRYPEAWLDPSARACLAAPPEALTGPHGGGWLFRLAHACGQR
jgi:hypothetical protein